ncbi:ABC transporter substrate-binding protein [Cetobacterium sp. 2G large]|uniref:ABC transporter substrate-binding protein n=1 Tax=Cetobacterium sp. 2G large TaxID=2759680 RepID=UPI00163CC593|nr:ABC transporter substrate-binding protein [Cetobacterium sp. 2G large]MBC2853350.1 ABC transporter substrate-binding protein [Cetobacterium sp. 2G large]
MKKILTILILVTLLLSCNSKKEDNLKEVSIILDWYPNAVHSFLYTAVEKGYFKDEGIKLNIIYPSSPSDSLTLPAAKKADIGISYLNSVIMARANENVPIKSFGAILQRSVNTVISLKEKNITSPKDFQNKIAGTSGGILSETYLKSMMISQNLDPNSLKITDVGFELLTSMITNQVDFTIGNMINHEVPVIKEKGIDINYFLIDNFGIPQAYELILVANDELLNQNKDTYTKVLKAMQKGFEDVKNNPSESLNLLLSKQAVDQFPLSETVERESLEILLPIMETPQNKFLTQTKKVWENNVNWLYENGIIQKKLPAENFIYQF